MDNIDIVSYIFQFLKLVEIIKCSTINILIKKVCDTQYERLLICDYEDHLKIIINSDYKKSYIRCYRLDSIRKKYMPDMSLIYFFNLIKIDLNYNKIKEIPKSIGDLVNLQKIDLSYNQIKKIPESIGQLNNLQILKLSNNKIKEIPESIGVETSATALVRLFTCL